MMNKILVVEDDLDIQELLQNFLQESGYDITVANDGLEAINLFSCILHFLLAQVSLYEQVQQAYIS